MHSSTRSTASAPWAPRSRCNSRRHGRRTFRPTRQRAVAVKSGPDGCSSSRPFNLHLHATSSISHQAPPAERLTTGRHRRGALRTRCEDSSSRSRLGSSTAARRRSWRSSVERGPRAHRADVGCTVRCSGDRLRAARSTRAWARWKDGVTCHVLIPIHRRERS